MASPGRHRLALILFCAAVWLPGLPARTLWPTDEPRYALIARDMAESRDYVVPVKRGQVYHSQPPLFIWAEVIASYLMGGVSEAAVRLPSFLAGLGGVLVVHALAVSLFGASAGLAAALALATDVRYLLSAQWAATDMLLCFFLTAALACFHRAYTSGRKRWYLAMYAMAGLAALTKGPVGMVVPGMVVLAFLACRRDLREAPRMRLPEGALIVSAILAPWLILFWRQAGAEELSNLVLKQSFQRYTEAWNNLAPWHYFLWRFPLDFLPWTPVFLIAAATSRRMRPDARDFLWCWFGVVFLFFSASSAKRGVYILPLHPAAAMMVGWAWDRGAQGDEGSGTRRWLRRACLSVALLFAGVGLAAATGLRGALRGTPGADGACLLMGALCVGAGAVIGLSRLRRGFAAIAGGTALVALAGVLVAAPVENRRQNVTSFSAEIARLVPQGAPLGIVRDRYEDLVFYSRRRALVELRPGQRLERWMSRPETVYAVLDRAAHEDLLERPALSWELLAHQVLAGEEYYLLVNRRKEPDADSAVPLGRRPALQ